MSNYKQLVLSEQIHEMSGERHNLVVNSVLELASKTEMSNETTKDIIQQVTKNYDQEKYVSSNDPTQTRNKKEYDQSNENAVWNVGNVRVETINNEEGFQQISTTTKSLRSILTGSALYSVETKIHKIIVQYISGVRAVLDNAFQCTFTCHSLARNLTRTLDLIDSICRNFSSTYEYMYRLSEIIAFYVALEMNLARSVSDKSAITNRISGVIKRYLRIPNEENVSKTNILRMFILMPTTFRDPEILVTLYKDLIPQPLVVMQKEISDKTYIQYLIIFYTWLQFEKTAEKKEEIITFAEKFMRPSKTLCMNSTYAYLLPKYTSRLTATRYILQNLKFFKDILYASIFDNSLKNMEGIIDFSEDDHVLESREKVHLHLLTKCTSNSSRSNGAQSLIKLENPTLVDTVDLTTTSGNDELDFIEHFIKKAIEFKSVVCWIQAYRKEENKSDIIEIISDTDSEHENRDNNKNSSETCNVELFSLDFDDTIKASSDNPNGGNCESDWSNDKYTEDDFEEDPADPTKFVCHFNKKFIRTYGSRRKCSQPIEDNKQVQTIEQKTHPDNYPTLNIDIENDNTKVQLTMPRIVEAFSCRRNSIHIKSSPPFCNTHNDIPPNDCKDYSFNANKQTASKHFNNLNYFEKDYEETVPQEPSYSKSYLHSIETHIRPQQRKQVQFNDSPVGPTILSFNRSQTLPVKSSLVMNNRSSPFLFHSALQPKQTQRRSSFHHFDYTKKSASPTPTCSSFSDGLKDSLRREQLNAIPKIFSKFGPFKSLIKSSGKQSSERTTTVNSPRNTEQIKEYPKLSCKQTTNVQELKSLKMHKSKVIKNCSKSDSRKRVSTESSVKDISNDMQPSVFVVKHIVNPVQQKSNFDDDPKLSKMECSVVIEKNLDTCFMNDLLECRKTISKCEAIQDNPIKVEEVNSEKAVETAKINNISYIGNSLVKSNPSIKQRVKLQKFSSRKKKTLEGKNTSTSLSKDILKTPTQPLSQRDVLREYSALNNPVSDRLSLSEDLRDPLSQIEIISERSPLRAVESSCSQNKQSLNEVQHSNSLECHDKNSTGTKQFKVRIKREKLIKTAVVENNEDINKNVRKTVNQEKNGSCSTLKTTCAENNNINLTIETFANDAPNIEKEDSFSEAFVGNLKFIDKQMKFTEYKKSALPANLYISNIIPSLILDKMDEKDKKITKITPNSSENFSLTKDKKCNDMHIIEESLLESGATLTADTSILEAMENRSAEKIPAAFDDSPCSTVCMESSSFEKEIILEDFVKENLSSMDAKEIDNCSTKNQAILEANTNLLHEEKTSVQSQNTCSGTAPKSLFFMNSISERDKVLLDIEATPTVPAYLFNGESRDVPTPTPIPAACSARITSPLIQTNKICIYSSLESPKGSENLLFSTSDHEVSSTQEIVDTAPMRNAKTLQNSPTISLIVENNVNTSFSNNQKLLVVQNNQVDTTNSLPETAINGKVYSMRKRKISVSSQQLENSKQQRAEIHHNSKKDLSNSSTSTQSAYRLANNETNNDDSTFIFYEKNDLVVASKEASPTTTTTILDVRHPKSNISNLQKAKKQKKNSSTIFKDSKNILVKKTIKSSKPLSISARGSGNKKTPRISIQVKEIEDSTFKKKSAQQKSKSATSLFMKNKHLKLDSSPILSKRVENLNAKDKRNKNLLELNKKKYSRKPK